MDTSSWWKSLANGADNISPVGMELSWIIPWPVPTVLTAHAHLMETAGKRRWCYLIWRLGTELDCSLTGTFYTCCTRTSDGKHWQMVLMLPDLRAWNWLVQLILDQCPLYLLLLVAHVQLMVTAGIWLWYCTCSSDGNRWYTILMLTSREAWKQFHSSLFCRCLPVPAAHARLIVGRGMRLSGVCRSMDGAWPAPGSGAHPDLLTASMKSNLEPLWKRKETTN